MAQRTSEVGNEMRVLKRALMTLVVHFERIRDGASEGDPPMPLRAALGPPPTSSRAGVGLLQANGGRPVGVFIYFYSGASYSHQKGGGGRPFLFFFFFFECIYQVWPKYGVCTH